MNWFARLVAAGALALASAACVVYEQPVPMDPMAQPWAAAQGALQDAGLNVVNADRGTGTLRGVRGNTEGVIQVRGLPDGRVAVEMTVRDPDNRDPGLKDRMLQAYNRRMGR